MLGKQINSSQRSIHPRVILHFTLFFCMYHLGSTDTPYLFKYQYQICTLTRYLCMHVSVVPLFFFSQKSADTSRIPSWYSLNMIVTQPADNERFVRTFIYIFYILVSMLSTYLTIFSFTFLDLSLYSKHGSTLLFIIALKFINA